MATAADLVRAARCEFAVLRALDAELGMVDPPAAAAVAPRGGDEELHARMRAEFGSSLVRIAGGERPAGIAAMRAAHAATLDALRAGATAVRDAVFLDDGFLAHCAYLVRDERGGVVLHATAGEPDARVGAVLELAACAEIASAAGVPVGHSATGPAPVLVVHCGATVSEHPLDAAAAVYPARRDRVREILDEKLNELLPVQWGDPRYLACGRCAVCLPEATAARDLLLVAGMPGTVRARLREAGVHTVDRLAVLDEEVPGLSARTVAALRDQAALQVRSEAAGAPAHVLLDPAVLSSLPEAHPADLALTVDFGPAGEAVRWRLDERDGTLLSVPAGQRPVTQVLGYADAHLRAHPGARLYYYSAEVRAALLAEGDGLGDEELLDELLHASLMIDLYPVVRAAVVIGVESYRFDRLRALIPGERSDGVALLRIGDWLRRLQQFRESFGPDTEFEAQCPPPPSSVEAALAEYGAAQHDQAHPAAVMAAILGYRRRERRASSWAHLDRLTLPVREWSDAPGVLIADWGTVDTKWHRSPDGTTMRRFLTLTGRIGSGGGLRPGPTGTAAPTALPPGARVHTFYDRIGPYGRRATGTAVVLGCAVDAEFADAVRLEEILPEGLGPHDELPIAIAPGVPEWDFRAEAAVEATGQRLLMTLPELPGGAFFDILGRRPPRLHSGALPPVHGDHVAALTAAVTGLDDSYLVVQAPSGTGKTQVTAQVIAQLVTRRHWRIGIVAHSRPTVENLFEAIVAAGVLPELVAESEAEAVAPEWAVIDPRRFARFLDHAVNGCVIGGLPTDFTDPARVPAGSLDLLVVADAGRFPLAEVAAVAGGARSLLLVGDPQPAHAKAAHPAPVADSVLAWLLDGRDTVPPGRGYFLDRTRRMHPGVCGPLSRLYYDSRLTADVRAGAARHLDGVLPGIETVTVVHRGDSTESVTEAREVVRQVRALLGRPWTEGGQTRRLHPHDLFVIAPYEAQVGRIRTLLARAKIEDVLVGTVDRFRGRETAVVLISMTTSAPQDAPDGMAALFSPGLIRAAVSRAMWKAIVIRSPLLTTYLPRSPEELTEPGRFLRLG